MRLLIRILMYFNFSNVIVFLNKLHFSKSQCHCGKFAYLYGERNRADNFISMSLYKKKNLCCVFPSLSYTVVSWCVHNKHKSNYLREYITYKAQYKDMYLRGATQMTKIGHFLRMLKILNLSGKVA